MTSSIVEYAAIHEADPRWRGGTLLMVASVGCSVKVVQHHLGHAKASTTLDTYAHLWPDSEDTTRRVLEAVLERIVSHACHAVAVSE